MLRNTIVVWVAPAFLLSACALDPLGNGEPNDSGATTTTTSTGTDSGSSSATTSSSTTSQGGGGNGSTQSGGGGTHEGGGGGGQGAGGQGAGGQGAGGQGAGGQGAGGQGAGGQGAGGQGAGGQGAGGQGAGGQGAGGQGAGGQGAGGQGAGGQGAGACAAVRPLSFEPGGVTLASNTSLTPNTTSFGTCAETDGAHTHLYTYTTGPTDAFVGVVVKSGNIEFDPALSFHASCSDEALSTCFADAPCCSDQVGLQDEGLLSGLLAPGSTLTVAVSGFAGEEGDKGDYTINFRDYQYLFVEQFEPPPGQFVPNDPSGAWSPITGPACVDGSSCMAFRNVGFGAVKHSMTSVSFAARGIGAAVIGWHHQMTDALSLDDTYEVDVSVDGGTEWKNIYSSPGVNETANIQVNAPMIIGQDDVKLRFTVAAALGPAGRWVVDDVYAVGF